MPEEAEKTIQAHDLAGWKKLRRVAGLLTHLHEAGCDRDKAGNRELHFDDYVLLILLYLFNPLIDSMQLVQNSGWSCPEVRERLGIKRFSNLAVSVRVVGCLEPAIASAGRGSTGRRPAVRSKEDTLLKQLPGKLTLVDSSVIQTLCTVSEAMFLPLGDGRHSHAWRLHLQFDVDHHVPSQWEITPPKNTGRSDEKSALRRALKACHTYVMDRWYAVSPCGIHCAAGRRSYVCRVRDNSVLMTCWRSGRHQKTTHVKPACAVRTRSSEIWPVQASRKQRADWSDALDLASTARPHQKPRQRQTSSRRRTDRSDQRWHSGIVTRFTRRHRPT